MLRRRLSCVFAVFAIVLSVVVSGGVADAASGDWEQRGADIDGEAPGDRSANSVASSADGTTVAIGANGNDGNGTNSGHVRVLDWNGSAWVQRGTDIDGEAPGDQSGYSVGLSADGNTVAVGAINNAGNGTLSGHVRVFDWNGSAWVQRGTDIDGEAPGDESGYSVGLSADGNTVAVGATLNVGIGGTGDIGGTIANGGTIASSGHVRVFDWNGSAWVQRGTDIDGEAPSDSSGWSVGLSDDGNTVAVGAVLAIANGGSSGHVRVYSFVPDDVTVPDVVGLAQAAAETAITDAGLTVGVVSSVSSGTVPAGDVVSQDPVGGTNVAPGTAVDLVVSDGPAPVAVPDVVGLAQAAAETAITDAGLTVGVVSSVSSGTVPAGDVVSQDPVGGTNVAPGTAVDLVVSDGPAPAVGRVFYLSSTSSGNVGGVAFRDEDIVRYVEATDTWEMVFDGSDVRAGPADVDAFHVVSTGPNAMIHMSFERPVRLPGVGYVRDSDVVTFVGSTGSTTVGTFVLLFDGSDVSIKNRGEDIDAFTVNGSDLLFSTIGNAAGPGVSVRDEDLIAFSPTSTGADTAGSLSLFFDGSDVMLNPEDVAGASLNPGADGLYLSSSRNYNVASGALRGDRDDVLLFTPTGFGPNTSGSYTRVFNGDMHGYNEVIDGLHVNE